MIYKQGIAFIFILIIIFLKIIQTNSVMSKLRNSCELSNSKSQTRLRNSMNFLQSQLIRSSLSRNSTFTSINRISSLVSKKHAKSINKTNRQAAHQEPEKCSRKNNLQETLKELEEKIGKAKDLLKNIKKPNGLKGKNCSLVEEDYSIFQVESTIMKKNEDLGFDLTGNSTKLLSFSKNQSKNDFTLSTMKRQCQSPNVIQQNRRKNKLYYIHQIEKIANGSSHQRLNEHLHFSLKIFHSLNHIRGFDFPTMQEHKLHLYQDPQHKNKKTLLLDIDETILHCEEVPDPKVKYDFVLDIQVSENQVATAYISLRPYALSFLRKMSKIFQIIAFTASHESYADVVLDEIDPDKQIFSHRLYRSSCQQIAENLYTKDLRIVNRKLESMVLVDNSPYSYIFQLENGIPILPYHQGEDKQLAELEKYLSKISQCTDVRELNKKTFKLHRYTEYENVDNLIDLYTDQQK